MTIRNRLVLDGNHLDVNARYEYLIKTVHVYNYSPYNVYVSTSANASSSSFDYIIAPNTFGEIGTPSLNWSFHLDLNGIPSVFNAVQIDLFDDAVVAASNALPTPTGVSVSNLVYKRGNKAGNYTYTAPSSSVALAASTLDISTTVPTGKCLIELTYKYSSNQSTIVLGLELYVDGVLVDGFQNENYANGVAGTRTVHYSLDGLDTIATHTFVWKVTITGTATNASIFYNNASFFPQVSLVIL